LVSACTVLESICTEEALLRTVSDVSRTRWLWTETSSSGSQSVVGSPIIAVV
jgi:hypothetical protein